jgi:hypothetical protein
LAVEAKDLYTYGLLYTDKVGARLEHGPGRQDDIVEGPSVNMCVCMCIDASLCVFVCVCVCVREREREEREREREEAKGKKSGERKREGQRAERALLVRVTKRHC